MKNVYLVQRLRKPTGTVNPFVFGGGLVNGGFNPEAMKIIKDIMSFDYMGAAEFEWGAVPTAIKALITGALDSFELQLAKPIYVICPTLIRDDVTKWIINASNGDHGHTKERVGLKEVLNNQPYNDYCGWLKIEEDKYCDEPFMFFTDKTMFENMCKLIGI